MKLTFLYPKNRFDSALTLPTAAYHNIWKQDGERIQRAFEKYTGLTFQQKEIKVKVHSDISMSGTLKKPMRLNSRNYTLNTKRFALVHELGHRLLSGNQLGSLEQDDDQRIEEEHKRLYLFEGDVLKGLYGLKAFTEWRKLRQERDAEAFAWADGFSKHERQQKLNHLIATNELV